MTMTKKIANKNIFKILQGGQINIYSPAGIQMPISSIVGEYRLTLPSWQNAEIKNQK